MELETTAKIPVEYDSENSYRAPNLEVVLTNKDPIIVLRTDSPYREIKIDSRTLHKVLRMHLED